MVTGQNIYQTATPARVSRAANAAEVLSLMLFGDCRFNSGAVHEVRCPLLASYTPTFSYPRYVPACMPVDDVFEDFNDRVNMSVSELEDWKNSNQFDVYAEKKSGGENINKPVDDTIRLLETSKADWEDKDDGFNEVEEAEQLLSFTSRMQGNESGEPMPGSDPPLSKQEASLLNWGLDPNEDKSDFVGDRQR